MKNTCVNKTPRDAVSYQVCRWSRDRACSHMHKTQVSFQCLYRRYDCRQHQVSTRIDAAMPDDIPRIEISEVSEDAGETLVISMK